MSIPGGYSVILHGPRLKFKLSVMEACVASLIYNLSASPRNPVLGWCTVGTQRLANFIGDTSRQTVYRQIEKLIAAGLVQRHPKEPYIQCTLLYYDNFEAYNRQAFLGTEQNVPNHLENAMVGNKMVPSTEQNVPGAGPFCSPITNSKRVVTNKIKGPASLSSLSCYCEELDNEWENFKELRKKIRKPLTAHAEQLNINKLGALAGSDPDLAVKIVQQSTMEGWSGLFPLKENYNGGGRNFQAVNGTNSRQSVTAHSGGKKEFSDG